MALKLITAPLPIVTTAEIKKHVRAEYFTDDDAYLEACIAAATDHVDGKDGWLGRALGTQTWDLVLDEFPCEGIRIPLPPLQSVTYLRYVSPETGLETDLTVNTDYQVDVYSEPGWIMPGANGWPAIMDTINAVRVRFVAGYETVPPAIKQAVMLLAAHYYENRESVVLDVKPTVLPQAVDALLYPRRNWLH